ncbi:hypothetical protein ThimaDRAFT_2710 [Thiocapsa marina 5811]|uniref:Uncharacterized protein n=1 Tax=Thiocapsa marina 5811 TaxID=768671 RepID=F9UCQ8_9GAMM|nr:hypothetical protein ThimaDRAFT_2710 [Thiocapsa marina 5811]
MAATTPGARPARRPTALQLVVVEPLRRLVAPCRTPRGTHSRGRSTAGSRFKDAAGAERFAPFGPFPKRAPKFDTSKRWVAPSGLRMGGRGPGALPRARVVSPDGAAGYQRVRFVATAGSVRRWIRGQSAPMGGSFLEPGRPTALPHLALPHLKQPALGQRGPLAVADDDVIKDTHVDQAQRFLQTLRDPQIRLAGFRHT